MAEKNIPAIVKAFEDFSIFCRTKWRAAILGVFFIAVLGGLFLLLYFGYKKIDSLETSIDKSVEILEETHDTPESLQEGLVASVAENLLIEKELSRVLLNSQNGVSAIFFKFHNSKMDLQGKHDFFYSAMNEVSKSGTNNYMSAAQNIPITALGQYMIPFVENRCQIVKTDEIVTNNWLRGKFESQNIGITASCPIYDISGRYLLGFVELVYPSGAEFNRTPENIETCMEESAHRLSVIVSKEVEIIKQ